MGIVPAHLALNQHDRERGGDDRLPGLDGLRGIAILLVMMMHFQLTEPYDFPDFPFGILVRSGWAGVDLFFVLSGFLITRILLEAKGEKHYFRNFYARRSLRILPLYYAFLAVLMFVIPLVGGPTARKGAEELRGCQWWMWTHMSNWLIASVNRFTRPTTLGTGGCWSLAIEEQYYLVWPLVVLLLSRRALLRTCLGLAAVSVATRFGLVLFGAPWAAVFTVTFARLDPIALGGALAILSQSPEIMRRLRAVAPWAALFGAAGFLAVEASRGLVPPDMRLSVAVQITLLSILWPAAFVITLMAPPGTFVHAVTHHAVTRMFGKYSYALYLFHANVTHLLRMHGRVDKWAFTVFGSVIPMQLVFMTACTLVTLGAAMLSWHLFEKHFLKLKKWFPSHPRRKEPEPDMPVAQEMLVTPAQTPR